MHEIDPAQTTRAYAFEMWTKAPMPMVTLIKTLDAPAYQPSERTEIQYADVLVHRQSRHADKGILYAAGRRQVDEI